MRKRRGKRKRRRRSEDWLTICMHAHPLDGAFNRIKRAEEHLADLKARIREVEANLTLVKFQRQGGGIAVSNKAFKPFARPQILSILVGETVYNLRAALDYLVFELAILDSGQTQERTQFPIARAEEGFRGSLKGVNPSHVALIENLQPYKGCEWTKTLASISNSDKHRLLQLLYGSAKQTALLNWDSSKYPPNRRADRSAPKAMHVQRPTLFITFPDGTLVTDKLEELKARVAETLEVFKSEF